MSTQATVYGIQTTLQNLLGLPDATVQYGTVNEALNILPNMVPPQNSRRKLGWFGISNKGHTFNTDAAGVPTMVEIPSSTTTSGLPNNLPFILRKMDNDLTPEERKKYRGRKVVKYNGVNWIGYHLKAFHNTPEVELTYVMQRDGKSVSSAFTPTLNDLHPEPDPILDTTPSNILSEGDEAGCVVTVELNMTREEIIEFRTAMAIVFGNASFAIISKISIVSGHDVEIDGTEDGSNVPRNELLNGVVHHFVSTSSVITQSTSLLSLEVNIGVMEPVRNFSW
jgi:hypothetical protein